jgi:uncharacterized protein (TIGR03435 family)
MNRTVPRVLIRVLTHALSCAFLAAVFSAAAFCQTAPHFVAADVHTGVRTTPPIPKGGFYRGYRYELHNATLIDLVRIAYGVDPDKVLGGPAWARNDVYDIIASAPPDTTPDSLKIMLQTLLSERLSLVAHRDTQPVPAYVITKGPVSTLKQADGTGDTGCKLQSNVSDAAAATPTPGVNIVRANINGNQVQLNLAEPLPFACRNMTMTAFVEGLRNMIGAQAYVMNTPIVDQTGLAGKWNFDVKWTFRNAGPMAPAPANAVTIFDAFDKLGLKMELGKAPFPVVVIDSANEKPVENPPGVSEKLGPQSAGFELAEIKPGMPFSNSGANDMGGGGFGIQPGGRITIRNQNIRHLIMTAWNLNTPDMVADGPPFLDSAVYTVDAILAGSDFLPGFPIYGSPYDPNSMRPMLQSLLKERFKLAVHEEDRPVSGYRLVAAGPKMPKADPSSAAGCIEGPAPGAPDPRKDNPSASRLVTCTNMTVSDFNSELRNRANGYLAQLPPIPDATGIQGKYNFTINFSPAGMQGKGTISLFDAMEQQLGLKFDMAKHPGTALVIDHCEEKPIDN